MGAPAHQLLKLGVGLLSVFWFLYLFNPATHEMAETTVTSDEAARSVMTVKKLFSTTPATTKWRELPKPLPETGNLYRHGGVIFN